MSHALKRQRHVLGDEVFEDVQLRIGAYSVYLHAPVCAMRVKKKACNMPCAELEGSRYFDFNVLLSSESSVRAESAINPSIAVANAE